ncbi:alanine--tRNA ligase [Salaquimonas pukyongi]|uniref:alanine--tRNA ligase n=1 Tax=Salaquimonas pukyongi TaxID=2712698 RepID=UPI00096BC4AC|nr:alanine--tRNA ligase [Salaquimonas pukyongi]
MRGVNEIRSSFLDFFKDKGHEVVASSPLVPRNDPTLMFTNSGMVQFKNVFTGLETRPYSRAATSQRCVRAGGKHNDLDNVGYTARHHTFFEMLGNFSFGDYFKEEAIGYAWELLTKEFGLDRDRLLVTVYHTDDQAFDLWKKIAGLADDRIIRIATHDNFWAMGDTGPCGPCSEIFYDHGDHIPGGPPGSPDEDGDRFIEIWNLVFMQFEQVTPDERIDLPKPSIDTGMGLERIAAVMQGVHDNYDIDLFRTLIAASEEATGVAAKGDKIPSHRVIADHLRAAAFLISDGVLPSNEGRGYVLRRIMRRAMRHASLLGAKDPLMHRLVPVLVSEMGGAYPELTRAEKLIGETLELEETRFRRTLDRGLLLLGEATEGMKEGNELDGETAFKLYDTYGFPLDLTQDALRRRGIGVDTDAFNAAMERQKAEARASWAGSGEAADERIWFELKEQHGATEFLGYETEQAEGVVQAIVADGKLVNQAKAGDEVAVVVNQTPFYGESGGQQGDKGEIRFEGGRIEIRDTRKRGEGLHVHYGTVSEGEITPGAAVELEVDHAARAGLRRHHSATHLVHEALRNVLGEHVAQKGSLVAPNRLRFDFSHQKAIEACELAQVEEIANEIVQQSAPVSTRLMAVDDAIEAGAMALFGEKYGDEVRVVSMGTATRGPKAGKTYSLELCGGTHVANTGQIGVIKILGESAVGSGVRRIEALTGAEALSYLEEQEARVQEIADHLKVPPQDAVARVRALVEERKRLERELAEAKKKLALGGGGGAAPAETEEVGGVSFLGQVLEGIAPRDLKGLVDEAKARVGSGVVAMVSRAEDGKAAVVVGVTGDLAGKISAVDLVRAASTAVGGKGGGGRPDMAQAGGPDGSKAGEALQAVRDALAG